MGVPIARLGDGCTHGAFITTCSSDRQVDGIPVATLGDVVNCPIHGMNQIISVQNTPLTDNKNSAHVNATSACGAVIVVGSPTTTIGF